MTLRDELRRRLAALEAARRRALQLIEGFPPDALNRAPAPGRWSALQVLHHVVTAEALSLAYVRKKMQAGAALPRAGLASRLRLLGLRLALRSPLRLRAPAATATVPATIDPDELRARWDTVRAELATLVEAFPPDLVGRLVFRHPFAGRMSLADTLGFMQAHLEHHLAQVERATASAPRAGSDRPPARPR